MGKRKTRSNRSAPEQRCAPDSKSLGTRTWRRGAVAASLAIVTLGAALHTRAAALPMPFATSLASSFVARDTAGALLGALADTADGAGDESTAAANATRSADVGALAYAGRDAHRRPRYVQRAFTADERDLLRRAFGVADPNRLWLPDSSAAAVLRYDAANGLAARVGYRSWRRAGETWEEFATRVRRLPKSAWPASARQSYHTGLGWLEPDVRATFDSLVTAARAAGFRVHVLESTRAAERQAYLLAHGNGRTLTATSAHEYGRAVDIVVDDGRLARPSTRRDWIAFRRWVLARDGGRFRLIGRANDTWDWPHVELVDPPVGFRSVDEALAAARLCLADSTAARRDDDPCALPKSTTTREALLATVRAAAHPVRVASR